MSDGIKNQIGPYRYADGAIRERAFAGGRKFRLLVAGAYDAGIVGPEHNGIVVLDENNMQVVLDQHLRESSGYFGPSRAQTLELQRIAAMDWSEFSKFCRENRRFRQQSMPDAFDAEPQNCRPEADRMLIPSNSDGSTPDHQFRNEVIEFLINHQTHGKGGYRGDVSLAWNVKVYNMTGDGRVDGYEPDERFDERWEKFIEGDFYWEMASEVVSDFLSGDFADGAATFVTAGRSGGWVVLDKFAEAPGGDLRTVSFEQSSDYREWLTELGDDALARFYQTVRKADAVFANPTHAMERAYAAHREMMEQEWVAETAPKI